MKQTELLKEKIAVLEELVYNLTYRGERKERLNLRKKLVTLTDQINAKTKKPKGSKIKICAGCGSFAHGNPGHDISI